MCNGYSNLIGCHWPIEVVYAGSALFGVLHESVMEELNANPDIPESIHAKCWSCGLQEKR